MLDGPGTQPSPPAFGGAASEMAAPERQLPEVRPPPPVLPLPVVTPQLVGRSHQLEDRGDMPRFRGGAADLDGTADGEIGGLALIDELLSKPPSKAAEWALDQACSLAEVGTDVRQLPIFRLAQSAGAISAAQRQELVRHAVAGFGRLPPHRQAVAVRIAVEASELLQASPQSSGDEGRRPATVDRGTSSSARPPPPPLPVVKNLQAIMQETSLGELSRQEVAQLAEEVQSRALQEVQPERLLGMVSELRPKDRERLSLALAEGCALPEDQRGLVEAAVRPGGFTDKLTPLLWLFGEARRRTWVLFGPPVVELILALACTGLPCSWPLAGWLRGDAVLSLCVAILIECLLRSLNPVLQKLRADPMGAAKRWSSMKGDDDIIRRLEAVTPGLDLGPCTSGGLGFIFLCVLLVIGVMWLMMGVAELLGGMVSECTPIVLHLFVLFFGLRVCMAVVLAQLMHSMLSGGPGARQSDDV